EHALLDLPGHDRVRAWFLERHAADARSLLFLVDAAAALRDDAALRHAADMLYDVLALPALAGRPLLLVAAKADAAAGGEVAARLRRLLEHELGLLRSTRAAAVRTLDASSSSSSSSSEEASLGGPPGQPFSLERVGRRVDVLA